MDEEIKEILSIVSEGQDSIQRQQLVNYITNLQKENTDLKKLCDKYEEEHKTTFETWKKVIVRNEKAIELLKRIQQKYGYMLEDVIFLLLQGGDE